MCRPVKSQPHHLLQQQGKVGGHCSSRRISGIDQFLINIGVIQRLLIALLCLDPSPEGTLSKKQSLASRLSQKFQAFKAAPEEDDDFQPDRKRLRTPEKKVLSDAFLD